MRVLDWRVVSKLRQPNQTIRVRYKVIRYAFSEANLTKKLKEKLPAWQKTCYNYKGLNYIKEVCKKLKTESRLKAG